MPVSHRFGLIVLIQLVFLSLFVTIFQNKLTQEVTYTPLVDVWDETRLIFNKELPVYPETIPLLLKIPGSGDDLVEDLVRCIDLVVAGNQSSEDAASLDIGKFNSVNVDLNTLAGVRQASSLGLTHAPFHKRLLVSTHLLQPALQLLFTEDTPAILLVMMIHPVERASRLFYSRQQLETELKSISLLEYYKSDKLPMDERNWMTRTLANKAKNVSESDLQYAANLIEAKSVIGMSENTVESIERISSYLGWDTNSKYPTCLDQVKTKNEKRESISSHRIVAENSPEWEAIVAANQYDMQLYLAAKVYYRKQRLFLSRPTSSSYQQY